VKELRPPGPTSHGNGESDSLAVGFNAAFYEVIRGCGSPANLAMRRLTFLIGLRRLAKSFGVTFRTTHFIGSCGHMPCERYHRGSSGEIASNCYHPRAQPDPEKAGARVRLFESWGLNLEVVGGKAGCKHSVEDCPRWGFSSSFRTDPSSQAPVRRSSRSNARQVHGAVLVQQAILWRTSITADDLESASALSQSRQTRMPEQQT
jgi:hypothetical protein